MESYDEEIVQEEERKEVPKTDPFKLIPSTRNRSKPKKSPTFYGLCNNKYENLERSSGNVLANGTLVFL